MFMGDEFKIGRMKLARGTIPLRCFLFTYSEVDLEHKTEPTSWMPKEYRYFLTNKCYSVTFKKKEEVDIAIEKTAKDRIEP